jgi:CHAT domain-containing protein/Tfp pilus assembly protein PilF
MGRGFKYLILIGAVLVISLASVLTFSRYLPFNSSLKLENREEKKLEAAQIYEAANQEYEAGNYLGAIEIYQRALKIQRQIGDRSGEADTLDKIGAANNRLENYDLALKFYRESLEIRQEIGDLKGVGSLLNSWALIYHKQGNYEAALNLYQQALVFRQEQQDIPGEGRTLNNIGRLYEQQGNYAKALEFYGQALEIFRTDDNYKKEEIAVSINLGLVSNQLGEYEEAIKLYRQSLDELEKIDIPQFQAIIAHNLGWAYENQKSYQEALQSYQFALEISREIGDKLGTASSLNSLGLIYDKLGEPSQGLKLLQEALAIFRELGAKWEEGRTLDSIGKAYHSLANYEKALDFYQRSLAVQKATGDRSGERITLSNMGDIFAAQNRLELAIFFYKQSVNLTETIRRDLESLSRQQQQSYTQTVAKTYRSLADLLLQQNRVIEGQEILDLLKVQELDDYFQNVRGNEITAQGIQLLPPEREILEKYEKIQEGSVILEKELLRLREIPETERSPQQRERLKEIEKELLETIAEINEFIGSKEVLELVKQMQKIAKSQQLTVPILTQLYDLLRQHKEQNAVIFYPLVLPDRLELILVTANSPPLQRTVSVNEEEINRAIATFRSALTNRNRAEFLSRFNNVNNATDKEVVAAASQLYEWLIKPIENDLKTAKAQTIIYAPDGQLRYLPLAALYDGKQWLVERFRINNITAASLLDFETVITAETKILAGGLSEGNFQFEIGAEKFDFQALKFAEPEVETVAALFPNTTKLLGKDFTMSGMVSRMNGHNIVHLATHAAFVQGQPEDSFILFGDGNLVTVRDVGNWDLKDVKLVVLSACQTGVGGVLGNGEEILGLGYMMQQAGALASVATLWRVDDAATQQLMEAFYRELQGGNIEEIEALRRAQLSLIRSNYKGGHPYYWAPFILIGNGL